MRYHVGSHFIKPFQLLIKTGIKILRNLRGKMKIWHRKGYPVKGEPKFQYYFFSEIKNIINSVLL